ncbi:MAG: serine hydrolase [Bacteroidia bacterium]|nr:serine hydrolase [Bacteroidia bacterium]
MKRITYLLLAVLFSMTLKAQNEVISNRISQFENHLALQMVIKGEGEEIKYFNIYDRMKYYNVPGVSIALINNGKIEWAKGYGYFSRDRVNKVDTNTLFQAASISKPVVALAALELVENGKLNLDNDINDYLKNWNIPDNKFTDQRKITLRMLLTHTAGIRPGGCDSIYNPDKPLPTIIEILDGRAPAEPAPVVVDTLPGTTWQYANAGFMVIQKAIMDNTDNDFASYMNKHILSKIGMKNSTFRQPLPKEYFKNVTFGNYGNGNVRENKWNTYPQLAAGGLWSTPSDLARFAIVIQNSYQGKSNKIISQNMTKQMLTKGLGNWGLGFCLDGQNDSLSFSHGGSNDGFRCNMFAFASLDKGIVIMTNSDNGEQLYNEILRSASIVYNWNKYTPVVKTVIDFDTISLKKYVGTYQLQPGAEVDFTIKDNKLYGRNSWDNYSYPIYAESEIKFFEIKLPLEIKFDINQTKEVIGADIKNMDKKYYFKKIK